jgi:hypothetical protein
LAREQNTEKAHLLSLARSLQPLQDYFNGNSEKRRFLALLSPT